MLRTLLALVFGIGTSYASIQDCSKGTSRFTLTKLALQPDPPIRGEPVDMIVQFVNDGPTVASGTVQTSVSVNYVPFPTSTKPLCEMTGCPILTGSNDRSTRSVWPDSVSGKVSSKIQWLDDSGASLLCIQLATTVSTNHSNALRGFERTVGPTPF